MNEHKTLIVVHGQPNPKDPDGPQRRSQMLSFNIEKIEMAFQSIALEPAHRIVLVLDLNDPVGYTLASLTKPEYMNKTRGEINEQEGDWIPTAIIVANRWSVYKRMRQLQKLLHRGN